MPAVGGGARRRVVRVSWGVVSREHALATVLGACIGDGTGCHLARWHADGRAVDHFLDVADQRRARALTAFLAEGREVWLFPAPRAKRGVRYAGPSSVLWARVEGSDQAQRLQRFQPRPTIVLREGSSSRATALWALHTALPLDWTQRGCERLAYALRSLRKHADPDGFWLPVPGCCLRDGRTRPVPVVTVEYTDLIYRPREVVGRLKDPPARDAWKERTAA